MGTLVKGQGKNYQNCEPSRKDDWWAMAELWGSQCWPLISKLTDMWWMMEVIHYKIGWQVSWWFQDLVACVSCLVNIFPDLFHRQTEFTILTFRGAQFSLKCNLVLCTISLYVFLWAFIVCIISCFGAIKSHLTWLGLTYLHDSCRAHNRSNGLPTF